MIQEDGLLEEVDEEIFSIISKEKERQVKKTNGNSKDIYYVLIIINR